MMKPVVYLAVVVLLYTLECSGLEWEFGSNLSGSESIMEEKGIIPSYMLEKRVQISKPNCIDVVYVKVNVEGMPIVTYNIHIAMVIIKFGRSRRTKNSEFSVSAKGIKSDGAKCSGTTPMANTGYPEGENPFIERTPYIKFTKEYFTNDPHSNNGHSYAAPPYDA